MDRDDDEAPLKTLKRGKEILEEFTERDGGQQQLTTWTEETIYLPPWRELVGNRLGPEYGPLKQGTYRRQHEEWQDSRAGGGLWDQETADATNPGASAARKRERFIVERMDHEEMSAFFYAHGALWKDVERELYYSYYEDGRSLQLTAQHIGIGMQAAKSVLRRLRERLDGWLYDVR